jgi:serine/threonine protein kinase
MSMASALANYGTTSASAKSSPHGSRRGQIAKINGKVVKAARKGPGHSGGNFEAAGQLGVSPAVGLAAQARVCIVAHKVEEREMARRVQQLQISSLEFFTPSQNFAQPQQRQQQQRDDSDEDEKEEEDCSLFKVGRLAYQTPCIEHQTGRYLYVRATSKKELCALKAERRWLQSLQLWAKLPASPSLLALAGAGESKRHLYSMTEWDGGESLAAAAERGVGGGMGISRLKRKAVAFYIAQVIDALDVLHEQRVVYRSLTPASLLLDGSGNLQLGSFGLAKQLGASASPRHSIAATTTAS